MKDALVKLLKVKSILSIMCAALLFYCTIVGKIEGKDALVIIATVFTYYFTKRDENGEPEE